MSLLDWIFGKKPKTDEDVYIMLSKAELKAFESTIQNRLNAMQMNLDSMNGRFGQVVQGLKAEIAEKDEQLREAQAQIDEASGQLAEVQDIELKRKRLAELAPDALAQLGYNNEQVTRALQVIQHPQARETVEGLIQEYFPDTPVTLEGLLQLAPVVMEFLKKADERGANIGDPAGKQDIQRGVFR